MVTQASEERIEQRRELCALALLRRYHWCCEDLVGEPADGVFERDQRGRGLDAIDRTAGCQLRVAQSVEGLDDVSGEADAAQLADWVAGHALAEASNGSRSVMSASENGLCTAVMRSSRMTSRTPAASGRSWGTSARAALVPDRGWGRRRFHGIPVEEMVSDRWLQANDDRDG